MAIDPGRFKSHAAVASVVLVMLAAAAGCWAFALSLRPCRVRFDPGTLVSYRLVSEFAELGADDAPGEPVTRENEISLVCIGADNEVALVGPGGGGRDEVTLLSFAADGATRVLDGDSRAGDDGKALGFFDFNLLPLPRQPTDQAWTVPLVYSALPPGKRNVEGKVRRISNSATPEFELKLFQHSVPTIEWVNERNRYQQVRDLVCTYRFDPRLGLVDHATVKCLAGVERDDGRHLWRVRVDLDLAAVQRAHDDVGALRDLALASRDVQDSLAADHRAQLAPLLRRLAESDVQDPRLRAVAAELLTVAQSPDGGTRTAPPPPPTAQAWTLRVRVLTAKSRSQAERQARELNQAGYPARVAAIDTRRLQLLVGPYAEQDPRVLAAVAKRVTGSHPEWVEVAAGSASAAAR